MFYDKVILDKANKRFLGGNIMSNHRYKIFISHSVRDKGYAHWLVDLLVKLTGDKNTIYCSSLGTNTNGADYGSDFDKDYINAIKGTEAFMLLVSKDYLESKTSLIELGGALTSDKAVFPFILPGGNYELLSPLYNLRNKDVYNLNDEAGLQKAITKLQRELGFEINLGSISKDIGDFIKTINLIKTEDDKRNSAGKVFLIISADVFNKVDEFQQIMNVLGQNKIIETYVSHVQNDKVISCEIYLKASRSLADLEDALNGYGHFNISATEARG